MSNSFLAQALDTVVGVILAKPDQAATILSQVRGEDLPPPHRQIVESVNQLRINKVDIEPLSVADEMRRRGTLSRAGGLPEIHRIFACGFGDPAYSIDVVNTATRLTRLQNLAIRTEAAAAANDAEPLLVAKGVVEQAQAIIDGIEAEGEITTPSLGEFLATDDPPHDWVVPGLLERGDRLILTGSEGLGKALALDTPVLTTEGWATQGALQVGDHVFAPDGKPTRVVAVTDVMHDRPCYRLTFSNGEQIVADEQHQWLTETVRSREASARWAKRGETKPRGTDQRHKRAEWPSVVTTAEIAASLRVRSSNVANHSIDLTQPLTYPDADLPIDPYVMGAWLGDGTSRGSGFTCADEEVVDQIRRTETVTKTSRPYGWSISDGPAGRRLGTFTARLRDAGVLMNKHVPDVYLTASVEQRIELLRGLMDTDGTVTATKNSHVCEYTGTNRRLVEGVHELALSLGINASIREGVATLDGRAIGPKWRVTFTTHLSVFHLTRKAERQSPSTTARAKRRYIVGCERIDSVPVRCIQVDREDGLYLASRSLVTTHNSVLQRQLAVAAASGVHPFTHEQIPPVRVLYVDCENGPVKLRRALRPLVHVGQRNGSDPSSRMWLEAIPQGLDLTRPEDEAWLVRLASNLQPDLMLTGPIYRLHAANPNDEEPARKVTAVLDRCRVAANCALVTEAHAGHGFGGDKRPIRPTGSSLWLRWPEFGYGMRAADNYDPKSRVVDFTPWRGDREERDWPKRLRSGGTWPWVADNPHPYDLAS